MQLKHIIPGDWVGVEGNFNLLTRMIDQYLTTGSSVKHTNFTSTVATGTQPYACASTTLNTNLNAEFLGGHNAAYFQVAGDYQPLSSKLTSLAGLTYASASFVKMTAANTFSLDTNTYQPLDADLTAIAALGFTSTAFLKKTAADTWALDTNIYYKSGDTPSFAGATISGTNKLYFGDTNDYIWRPYSNELHIVAPLLYIDSNAALQSSYGYLVGVDGLQIRDYGGGFYLDFEAGDPADLVVTGYIYAGRTKEDTDFDLNEVLETGITGYGLLIIYEIASLSESAIYHIRGNTAPAIISGNTLVFNTAKDIASRINVYYETNQIKVQNKITDNLNIRVGFYGI